MEYKWNNSIHYDIDLNIHTRFIKYQESPSDRNVLLSSIPLDSLKNIELSSIRHSISGIRTTKDLILTATMTIAWNKRGGMSRNIFACLL